MIVMRRMTWTAAIVLVLSLVLSACGTKDAESVIKDLDKFVSNMESYQGSGTMTIHTGQQPLTYQVEVSYQKPQYYRIKLTNQEKDITQIVLRNDDGVFVLTPRLNKVFRFQSDWPQNNGQVYLYQTLVQSILVDNTRQFASDENAYVFDVMANYNNGSMARQKIWLNKSDYKPVHVEVSDANAAKMVEVKFDSFEFGPKFDRSAFETEANMNASPSSSGTNEQPTMAEPGNNNSNNGANNAITPELNTNNEESNKDDEDANAEAGEGTTATDEDTAVKEEEANGQPEASAGMFQAMSPTYLPEGVAFLDSMDIEFGGSPGLLTRYTGMYDYSLIQTQPEDQAATFSAGTIQDLGFTFGELVTGEEQHTLTWTYEGYQYRLTSATLPDSEMIKVAQSVQADASK